MEVNDEVALLVLPHMNFNKEEEGRSNSICVDERRVLMKSSQKKIT
jgi:hypothetical protein